MKRVSSPPQLAGIVAQPVERLEYLDDTGVPYFVVIRTLKQAQVPLRPAPQARRAGGNSRGPFGGSRRIASAGADKDV